jgi:predicted phosphodiesterase
VVERVRGLPEVRCVRGNTDRYVLTGEVSGMIPPVQDGHLLAEVRESLAWTRASIAEAGHATWLNSQPIEERLTLPDGTRTLMVHASPGRDDGRGAHADASDGELAQLGFTDDVADLVLVGHTHVTLDRRANDTRIVNPGSISLPPTRDGLARWALVTSDSAGYNVELRNASYDVDDVIRDLHRVGHPSASWVAAKLRRVDR